MALLQSCVPESKIGTPFDTERMQIIRKNRDNQAQVVTWLGAPSLTELLPGSGSEPCVVRFRYQYAEPSMSKVLFVDFDRQGLVCALTYACSGTCEGSDAATSSLGNARER